VYPRYPGPPSLRTTFWYRPYVVTLDHGLHQPCYLRFRLPSCRRNRLCTMHVSFGVPPRSQVHGLASASFCFVDDHRVSTVLIAVFQVRPFGLTAPTMASADFSLRGFFHVTLSGTKRDLPGYDASAFTLMPVGSTPWSSVQVSGFSLLCCLTPPCRLVSASCSSGQRFASGFLQTSSHLQRPCLRLTLPLVGRVEVFHLLAVRPAGRTKKKPGECRAFPYCLQRFDYC
jgi:hypothetical protein